mmetsp:Transcript_3226/g.7882  ORF Transcript_3226/g.7882 Transcript_3226/m.7882 type:complete len:208 (-) Transcript_3226:183-806(-)
MVMRPKVSKSFSMMAFSMSAIRLGTTTLARWSMRADVLTDVCIPDDDDTAFFPAFTTKTRICISGQCSAGATCDATESTPSSRSPSVHRTHPPYTERQADPDPTRAIDDSSVSATPYTCASADTRQAYPAADDASPAAVGKLLAEHTRIFIDTRGSEGSLAAARARISRKQFCNRLFPMSSSVPLSHMRSSVNPAEMATVVFACSWS